MKPLYTMMVLAATSLCAYAQTSVNDAQELNIGTNTYTWPEGSTDYIYWKYTNTEVVSQLLTVGQNTSFVDASGGSIYGPTVQSGSAYPVASGQTVYMKSSTPYNSQTLTFTASVETIAYSPSTTAAAPAEFDMTLKNVFMAASYNSTNYINYTATEDGCLVLTSTGYITSASYKQGDLGGTLTFSYNSGAYVAKLPITKGATYAMTLTHSSSFILTGEITHPVAGESYDFAITAVDGENTVAAPFCEAYWYAYTPTQSGIMNITSDETLPAGSVSVYSDASNVTYDYPSATSEAGTFNTRCEVVAGQTYYIKIVKAETTAKPQIFTIAVTPYEAGDRMENPIILTSGEPQTLKSATGTYYYAIDIPADGDRIMNVTAEGITSTSTYLYLRSETYSYSNTFTGTAAQSISLQATKGTRYYFTWSAEESTPITFCATLKEIVAGDSYDNPLPAESGVNIFFTEGTKYYSYTATMNGRLSILPTQVESITVEFPKSASSYVGNYTSTMNNGASEIDVEAGTTYVIKFSGAGVTTAAGFTLSERAYVQGDVDTDPIPLEGSVYTLGNESVNVWVSYTVAQDGVLSISGDMECDSENYVEYKLQGAQYASRAYDGSRLTAEFPVEKGQVYVLHVLSPSVQPGTTVVISIRDFEAGESVDCAVTMQPGVAQAIPSPTRNLTTWAKVTLQSGTLTITSADNGQFGGVFYKSYADAKAGTNGTNFSAVNYDLTTYEALEQATWSTTVTIADGGTETCYVEFTQNYGSSFSLTFSGSAVVETTENTETPDVPSAIEGISAAPTGVTAVYDLTGRRIDTDTCPASRGTYIIRGQGRTRKVVIK